jgi:hypothetical protein
MNHTLIRVCWSRLATAVEGTYVGKCAKHPWSHVVDDMVVLGVCCNTCMETEGGHSENFLLSAGRNSETTVQSPSSEADRFSASQEIPCVYCIYGSPCKARNFNVVYIWTYVWQRWKPSLSIFCTMFQHLTNAESFPVSQLCVNTLPDTKITLITNEI